MQQQVVWPLERRRAVAVVNVAGELEKEGRSRAFNRMEALAVHLLVLVLLWPISYRLGVLPGIAWVKNAVGAVLGLLVLYILLVSPRLHGDTLAAWGLGSRARAMQIWREAGPGGKTAMFLGVSCLAAAMLWFNYTQWRGILSFFHLRHEALLSLPETWWGSAVVWLWGLLLAALFAGYAIRYDNFLSALRTAMKIALPLCLLICAGAWLHRGSEAFLHVDLARLLLQAFGYLFWGFLQQLLFSGYYCTRLRRGFAPASEKESMALRRWAVAGLIASLFATIHLNSYGLVLATFIVGAPLAYVFMEDRNRNLLALSTVHALVGATLYWLFANDASGRLEVEYRVGPWNIREPGAGELTGPIVVILVYVTIAVIFVRGEQRTKRTY